MRLGQVRRTHNAAGYLSILAAGPTPLFDDPFSAAGALTTPWTNVALSHVNSGGLCYANSSSLCESVVDVSTATMDITALVTPYQASSNAGIMFRYTDTSNFLAAYTYQTPAGSLILSKVVAGAYTTLGSITAGSLWTAGNLLTLRVVASANSLTVYANGASVITATESHNNTATKCGLFTLANGNYDRFTVY